MTSADDLPSRDDTPTPTTGEADAPSTGTVADNGRGSRHGSDAPNGDESDSRGESPRERQNERGEEERRQRQRQRQRQPQRQEDEDEEQGDTISSLENSHPETGAGDSSLDERDETAHSSTTANEAIPDGDGANRERHPDEDFSTNQSEEHENSVPATSSSETERNEPNGEEEEVAANPAHPDSSSNASPADINTADRDDDDDDTASEATNSSSEETEPTSPGDSDSTNSDADATTMQDEADSPKADTANGDHTATTAKLSTSPSTDVDENVNDNDDDITNEANTSATSTSDDEEDDDGPREKLLVDYASKLAGAQILEKSPSLKGASNLLTGDIDRYAIAPCQDKKLYVVVGLSEDILVKQIKLSNYERYSSHVREFQILASQEYPAPTAEHWADLGVYEAKSKSGEQAFELKEPAWARYLKFRFLSHYGKEHYCTVSQIKVHGSTMLQGFHEQWIESEKKGRELSGEEEEEVVEEEGEEEEEEEEELADEDGNEYHEEQQEGEIEKKTLEGEVDENDGEPDVKDGDEEADQNQLHDRTIDEESRDRKENVQNDDGINQQQMPDEVNQQKEQFKSLSLDADEESNDHEKTEVTKSPNESTNKTNDSNPEEINRTVEGETTGSDTNENEELRSEEPSYDNAVESVTVSDGDTKATIQYAKDTALLDDSINTTNDEANKKTKGSPSDVSVQEDSESISNRDDVVIESKKLDDSQKNDEDKNTSHESKQTPKEPTKEDVASIRNDSSIAAVKDVVKAAVADATDAIKEEVNVAVNEIKKMVRTRMGAETLNSSTSTVQEGNASKASFDSGVKDGGDASKPDTTVITKQNPHSTDSETQQTIADSTSSAAAKGGEKPKTGESPSKITATNSERKPSKSSILREESKTTLPAKRDMKNSAISNTELITKLSRHFPSAACIKDLDFKSFKTKTLLANSGPGAQQVGGGAKMEPIFAKITNEIKSVQISQQQYEQYIAAAKACYEKVFLDMANELDSVQMNFEFRLSTIEERLSQVHSRGEISAFRDSASMFLSFLPLSSISSILPFEMNLENPEFVYMCAGIFIFVCLLLFPRKKKPSKPKGTLSHRLVENVRHVENVRKMPIVENGTQLNAADKNPEDNRADTDRIIERPPASISTVPTSNHDKDPSIPGNNSHSSHDENNSTSCGDSMRSLPSTWSEPITPSIGISNNHEGRNTPRRFDSPRSLFKKKKTSRIGGNKR